MEENNNIFSQNETEGEKIVSDDTQVQNEAVSEDGADVIDDAALQDSENSEASEDGYVSQFSDIIGVTDEQAVATAVKVKKKRFVMPCIIISACVMLASVLIGVAFLFFFNTSVTGAYVIEGSEQEDTATTYFFFEDNGKLRQCVGTIEYEGTYKTTTEDNVSRITFEIPNRYVNVTYNYKLDGNKLTGMKMILSDDKGNSMTFLPVQYEEPKLEPIDKAQLDSKLIGKWEDTAGYGLVYTFSDDYRLVMSGNGMNIYCYYSAENGEVKFKYYTDDVVESSVTYSFSGESLKFNDVEFKKVTE